MTDGALARRRRLAFRSSLLYFVISPPRAAKTTSGVEDEVFGGGPYFNVVRFLGKKGPKNLTSFKDGPLPSSSFPTPAALDPLKRDNKKKKLGNKRRDCDIIYAWPLTYLHVSLSPCPSSGVGRSIGCVLGPLAGLGS